MAKDRSVGHRDDPDVHIDQETHRKGNGTYMWSQGERPHMYMSTLTFQVNAKCFLTGAPTCKSCLSLPTATNVGRQ